jgi:linoleoyl-CoA desaturase
MKTLKFLSNDPNQKAFVQALKKNVNSYFKEKGISTKGNWRLFFKSLAMLGLYLAPFILLLFMPVNIWIAILLVILMGIGEAGVGMSVMHDAVHGSFSDKKWVNELFSYTMLILGSNVFNWKVQHNIMHHTYTNIYGYDPDIDTKAIIRLSEHAPVMKYNRYQYVYAFFLYGMMTLFKLTFDFAQLATFNRMGITKELSSNPVVELLKLLLIKIIYLLIVIGLPLFLTDYLWWQILIGFVMMHLTAGLIMSTTFQMAHVVKGAAQPLPDKKGIIHNEWEVHQLQTTSDFARNNLFLNWYIGGLNFQIEHHLFPHVSHIHYRKIAPIVEKTAKEFGLKYNLKSSFWEAFFSHAKRLKELGKT